MRDTKQIFTSLQKYFKIGGIDLSKVYIAGGSLIDLDSPKDIDLYVENHGVLNAIHNILSIMSDKCIETDNANTYKIKEYDVPVQLIKILIGPADDVVTRFDFEQNACYISFDKDFKTSSIVRTNNTKNLKLCNKVESPNTLMNRTLLMLNKGFTIEKGELMRVLHVFKESFKDVPDEVSLSKVDLGNFYDARKR